MRDVSVPHRGDSLTMELAPHSNRVNVVAPTNCNTDMIHNDAVWRLFRRTSCTRIPDRLVRAPSTGEDGTVDSDRGFAILVRCLQRHVPQQHATVGRECQLRVDMLHASLLLTAKRR